MEEEPIHPSYQQGFNEGYLVTQHWPEISESIAKVPNVTQRLDGFRDGRRHYVLELTKANRPKWMQRNPNANSPGKEKDGKDIDR